ncbi:MAG: hypothetical protein AB7T59_06830 [Hyphomonadaceae bacterium]
MRVTVFMSIMAAFALFAPGAARAQQMRGLTASDLQPCATQIRAFYDLRIGGLRDVINGPEIIREIESEGPFEWFLTANDGAGGPEYMGGMTGPYDNDGAYDASIVANVARYVRETANRTPDPVDRSNPHLVHLYEEYHAAELAAQCAARLWVARYDALMANASAPAAAQSAVTHQTAAPNAAPAPVSTVDASEMSDCLDIVTDVPGPYVTNTCAFRVNFQFCNLNAREGSDPYFFRCEGNHSGLESIDAGSSAQPATRRVHISGRVALFACRAPLTPGDIEFDAGQSKLLGRCQA